MTINDTMQWLEQFTPWIAIGLVALPVLTYGLGALLQRGSRRLAAYFLAAMIYLAVIPGMGMTVLILYMLFFLRSNLLRELHLILHLLPVLSMGATLWGAARLTNLNNLPGFERIYGLMTLVGLGFAAILVIDKARLGIFFLARFEHLLILLVGFLALWRLGVRRVFRSHPSARK